MDFYIELIKYVRSLDYDNTRVHISVSNPNKKSVFQDIVAAHKLGFYAPSNMEDFMNFMFQCIGDSSVLQHIQDFKPLMHNSIKDMVTSLSRCGDFSWKDYETFAIKYKNNNGHACINSPMRDSESELGLNPTMTVVYTPDDIADRLEEIIKKCNYTYPITLY
jgi:hypothetical protein